MSNRVFLIQSNLSNSAIRSAAPSGALAAASNCIPVYWFSLFDNRCLISGEVVLQDGAKREYPYLIVPRTDAKANILRRRPILESLNPRTGANMTDLWSRFVDQVELPFIHLDAAELWMMLEDHQFKEFLMGGLKAFETPSDQVDALGTNNAWLEILDVAQIDPNDLAGTATPLRLMGYSWGGHAVPWKI